MNAWFQALGEPVGDDERRLIGDYLRGLGLTPELPVEKVSDWNDARAIVTHPDWDRRWWDAEQRERQRIGARASATRAEAELLPLLSGPVESSDDVQRAASLAAERWGCEDVGLVRSAAGAASEALYLAELARLAGEDEAHPFRSKQALFVAGRWPLGILSGRYRIF